MFKIFKKSKLTNEGILVQVFIFKKLKRFFAVLGIVGMVWNYVPWQYISANTMINNETVLIEGNKVVEESLIPNYPTTTDSGFNSSKVAIEYEIFGKRTLTSKTFRKIDGTYEVAMYNDVIHFLDEGKYKDIDNSIVDLGNEIENKDNKFKVKFPKSIDDNKQIKLTMNKYSIVWNILGINSSDVSYNNEEIITNNIKELTNINQSIIYSDILNNVDLEYVLNGSGVKENIILNDYIEDFSLTFEYKLKDLNIIVVEDGEIIFVNEDNEIVFVFSDLYMFDSKNLLSENIVFDIAETGNKTYLITITPDDEWLKNAVYPVVIDPTITFTDTNDYIEDKHVSTNSNYPESSQNLIVGYDMEEYRSYFDLNLSILSTISSRQITYAFFGLHVNELRNMCSDPCNIQLKEVNSSYSLSNITTISDNYTSSVGSRIIDYRMIETSDLSKGVSEYYWDMTKIVKNWIDVSDLTRIVELRKSDTSAGYVEFDSVDDTSTGSVKPSLVVGYMDIYGLKDYWTYNSYSSEEAGVGYVSDFTGEMTFIRDELVYVTSKQTLGLSMIYNVEDALSNIGYGNGWKTSYNVQLLQDTFGNWIYEDATNSNVYYSELGSCDSRVPSNDSYTIHECFIAEDGSRNILVLRYNFSTLEIFDKYILTPNYGQINFGNDEYLDSIEDTLFGLGITITRDQSEKNFIEQIEDSSGNKIELSYINGLLSKIELKIYDGSQTHVLELINYTYNNDYLEDVVNKKNYNKTSLQTDFTVYYFYDYYNRLDLIELDSNLYVLYTYKSSNDNRISKVEMYNDDGITVSDISEMIYYYGNYHTKITNQNNDFVTSYFDIYGHTITVLNSNGLSKHTSYMNPLTHNIGAPFQPNYVVLNDVEPNYLWNHKIISESEPQITIVNPIYNHSFEYTNFSSDENWIKDPNATTYFTASFSDNESVFGNDSLRMYSDNPSKEYILQNVFLKDNFTYRLSGFIYNNTSTKAYLEVECNGVITKSEYVTSQNEWVEVVIVFSTPVNTNFAKIKLVHESIGIVYFDSIQINEGYIDTRDNLIDNSSFESNGIFLSNSWFRSDSTNISVVDYTSSIPYNDYYQYEFLFGESAIRFNNPNGGNLQASYGLYDLDYNNLPATLVVGSWSYIDYTSITAINSHEDSADKVYGIRVDFMSSQVLAGDNGYDDAIIDSAYINFDSTSDDVMQYILRELNVPGNTVFINISYVYSGAGIVYFDNLQVYGNPIFTYKTYKDSTGQVSYTSSPSGEEVEYNYNDLSNNPSGITVYDAEGNVKTDLTNDVSASYLVNDIKVNNISSTTTKNSDGQVTSVKIGEGLDYYISFTEYYSYNNQYVSKTNNPNGERIWYYYNELTGLIDQIEDEDGNTIELSIILMEHYIQLKILTIVVGQTVRLLHMNIILIIN